MDHLKIKNAEKDANFVAWTDVKAKLDKVHGLNSTELSTSLKAKVKK